MAQMTDADWKRLSETRELVTNEEIERKQQSENRYQQYLVVKDFMRLDKKADEHYKRILRQQAGQLIKPCGIMQL